LYCGEHSVVNEGEDTYTAVSLRCRSWLCPECHEDRRRGLIAFAFKGNANRFITLTVSPSWGEGKLDRARELARSWRNIVKCLKRRYPNTPINYLCVFEAQKSGEPHLHILYRGPWVDQGWLSDQMAKRMDAPIVDIRAIRHAGKVAAYVNKYIGKASEKFGTLKRYWSTRGFDLTAPDERAGFRKMPGNWQIWKFDIQTLSRLWPKQGFPTRWEGRLLICDRSKLSRWLTEWRRGSPGAPGGAT